MFQLFYIYILIYLFVYSLRNVQRTPIPTQQECGPVQSRSFRVLQKITDTDGDDVDNEQFRKLQLTEDDKLLMNKFKEQGKSKY